jgi:hypothetical protein
MEDRRIVEKRTVVTREDRVADPKTTNVNVGGDGSTQVQGEPDLMDDPAESTTIRREETVEEPHH